MIPTPINHAHFNFQRPRNSLVCRCRCSIPILVPSAPYNVKCTMINNVQYTCGTWQIYEHGCLRDVQLPPIILQFLLHYILEEYNMNPNSCTTIVCQVFAYTTPVLQIISPSMNLFRYQISLVWIAVEWLK